jgi:hypothetical protein
MVITDLILDGMTVDDYEAIGRSLDSGPSGIVFHGCGAVDGGWRIVDVWTSEDAWATWLDCTYLPAVRRAGGFPVRSRRAMPAHHAGMVG